jgi:hypothetical protein
MHRALYNGMDQESSATTLKCTPWRAGPPLRFFVILQSEPTLPSPVDSKRAPLLSFVLPDCDDDISHIYALAAHSSRCSPGVGPIPMFLKDGAQ